MSNTNISITDVLVLDAQDVEEQGVTTSMRLQAAKRWASAADPGDLAPLEVMDFARRLLETANTGAAGSAKVRHPAEFVSRATDGIGFREGRRDTADPSTPGRDEQGELNGAELMWLQRLPTDPKDISFDDAVRLARMAETVNERRAPSSAMLLRSVWEPVKARWDEEVARHDLATLRAPHPVSGDAIRAIRVLVERQNPGISANAAATEARSIAADFFAQREAEYQRKRASLARRLEETKARPLVAR